MTISEFCKWLNSTSCAFCLNQENLSSFFFRACIVQRSHYVSSCAEMAHSPV